jgi:hypothetical protein
VYYIEIEDLVANALIEIIENNAARVINFDTLTKYGDCIVKKLRDENKDVYLLLSRDRTNEFIHDYTEYFVIDEQKNTIAVKENIGVVELKKKFRSNMALDVFLACTSREALSALGVAA